MSLVLGVDLDGVVYDFYSDFREYVEYRTGKSLPVITPRWDFYNQLGMSEQQFVDYCTEGVDAGWIFRQGLPYEGAIPTLQKLKADGNEIHVITHRKFGTMSVINTIQWITQWGMPYDEISFAKAKSRIKVDLLVDDMPSNVQYSFDAGIPAVMMERPWNETHWDTFPTVSGWTDLYYYIQVFQGVDSHEQ